MKRLFLYFATIVVVFVAVDLAIVAVIPWSPINRWHQEINIQTGEHRNTRVRWWLTIDEEIKDTALSRALAGEQIKIVDGDPWRKVNTFSPGIHHSPHYAFHSALAQAQNVEVYFEVLQYEPERQRAAARRVLELWQTTNRDDGADPVLEEMQNESFRK